MSTEGQHSQEDYKEKFASMLRARREAYWYLQGQETKPRLTQEDLRVWVGRGKGLIGRWEGKGRPQNRDDVVRVADELALGDEKWRTEFLATYDLAYPRPQKRRAKTREEGNRINSKRLDEIERTLGESREHLKEIADQLEGFQGLTSGIEGIVGGSLGWVAALKQTSRETQTDLSEVLTQLDAFREIATVAAADNEENAALARLLRAAVAAAQIRFTRISTQIEEFQRVGDSTDKRTRNTLDKIQELGESVKDTQTGLMEIVDQLGEFRETTIQSYKQVRSDVEAIGSEVSRFGDQFERPLRLLGDWLNPWADPTPVKSPVGVLSRGLQRGLYILLYLVAVTSLLAFTSVTSPFGVTLFLVGGFALVFFQGMYRLVPLLRSEDSGEPTTPAPWISDLLFLSFFVMLSWQLFQALRTKVDMYGFFTHPALEGTHLPIVACLAVNLLLSLIGTATFQALGSLVYRNSATSPLARALWATVPAFAVVYLPAAIVAMVGIETGLLTAFAPLFAATLVMLVVSDPAVRIGHPEAKLLLNGTLITVAILFVGAITGAMIAFFFLQDAAPSGNHLGPWVVDFNALGYPAGEFAKLNAQGFLWGTLFTIAYLLVVVFPNLVMTIYRYQVAPYRRQTEL